MLGLGHAILTGEPLIGNEPFAVILADDLCFCSDDGVISQMIKVYEEHQCSVIAVQEIPYSQIENYGVISGDLISGTRNTYRVNNMIEKPNLDDLIDFIPDELDLKHNPNGMAIIGRYILTPDIFEILRSVQPDKSGEIQITDALLSQAKKGKVIAYKFKGRRFDCGSVKGFIEATNYFASIQGIT